MYKCLFIHTYPSGTGNASIHAERGHVITQILVYIHALYIYMNICIFINKYTGDTGITHIHRWGKTY